MNKIIILLSCVLTSERKPPAIGGSNYSAINSTLRLYA